MPIPIEVCYTKTGNKKTRNVTGVICPKTINQLLGFCNTPIYVELGDIKVDWQISSVAFSTLINNLTAND